LAKDCQMIESIQKFASRVCLNQWSRNTRYQDMLDFFEYAILGNPQETEESVHIIQDS